MVSRILGVVFALLISMPALAQNTPTDTHTPVQANKNATITGNWNFESQASNFATGKVLCRFFDDAGSSTHEFGPVIAETTFSSINFNSYTPAGHASNWSVRCQGFIKPVYTETYTFSVTTEEGARLWVNGVNIIDQFALQAGPQTYTGSIALTANQWVPFLIDHFEDNIAGETLSLAWSSPSQAFELVHGSELSFAGLATPVLGTATVMGKLGINVLNPGNSLDIGGATAFRASSAPSPVAGQAILYTDGATLKLSQNGGAFNDIATTSSSLVHLSDASEAGFANQVALPLTASTLILGPTSLVAYSGTKKVQIHASASFTTAGCNACTSTVALQLYRDGFTKIAENSFNQNGAASDLFPTGVTIDFTDVVTPGNHTYGLIAQTLNAVAFYNAVYITVDELP